MADRVMIAWDLGRVMHELGENDAAARVADSLTEDAPDDDIWAQITSRGLRAMVAARTGSVADAVALSREAEMLAGGTDERLLFRHSGTLQAAQAPATYFQTAHSPVAIEWRGCGDTGRMSDNHKERVALSKRVWSNRRGADTCIGDV
jgi:hypothetical protein